MKIRNSLICRFSVFLAFIFLIFVAGCEKENKEILIGKWKYVKHYSVMGGENYLKLENQLIDEYTKDYIRSRYDYSGNEISKCSYSATNSEITLFGENLNGTKWNLKYEYRFLKDTLRLRINQGEYNDDFFIRVE